MIFLHWLPWLLTHVAAMVTRLGRRADLINYVEQSSFLLGLVWALMASIKRSNRFIIQKTGMLNSIFYTGQSTLGLSTFPADKKIVAELLGCKAVILLILFILPPIVQEGTLCIILTLAVSIQFWISKNLGRKFLQATWYVDTTGQQDQWVYQASLKSPQQMYEGIFWYSFIFYGMMLFVMGLLIISQGKLSLFCAVCIGLAANFINFYAFGQIIEMRNLGILDKLTEDVYGGVGENIKIPLGLKSKLPPINQDRSAEQRRDSTNNRHANSRQQQWNSDISESARAYA